MILEKIDALSRLQSHTYLFALKCLAIFFKDEDVDFEKKDYCQSSQTFFLKMAKFEQVYVNLLEAEQTLTSEKTEHLRIVLSDLFFSILKDLIALEYEFFFLYSFFLKIQEKQSNMKFDYKNIKISINNDEFKVFPLAGFVINIAEKLDSEFEECLRIYKITPLSFQIINFCRQIMQKMAWSETTVERLLFYKRKSFKNMMLLKVDESTFSDSSLLKKFLDKYKNFKK